MNDPSTARADAGDLDPVEAMGDIAEVLGLDGAVGKGAELLGGELADVSEGLGADAVGDGERVRDAGDHDRVVVEVGLSGNRVLARKRRPSAGILPNSPSSKRTVTPSPLA